MEENKKEESKRIKTREGSGYLRQLYSTARSTAGTNASNFKNLTTFLVNFIPVDRVDASELQVRVHFDDSEITGLAESIKQHGVLQPILVVQNGDRYKVIAGERRLRASKLAGLERIPARIINSDDKAVHEIALRENLDRVDLHPIEEGEGYLSLLEVGTYKSHEAIALAFHKKKSRVTECIGYTRLPDETKKSLLNLGVRGRAVLRNLMQSPVEQHQSIIEQAVLSGADDVMPSATAQAQPSDADSTTATPVGEVTGQNAAADSASRLTLAKAPARELKYRCTSRSVSISGFKWKAGEGKERLHQAVRQLEQLLSEAKALL